MNREKEMQIGKPNRETEGGEERKKDKDKIQLRKEERERLKNATRKDGERNAEKRDMEKTG